MTGNQALSLFSVLAVSSLVSGHHLAAAQHDRRFGLVPEPASWCYTYFSYYLAPLETPSYGYPPLGGGGVVTTITSIGQPPSLVPTFPTPILTTLPSGFPSLSPAPPPSASGPSPLPSSLPGPVEIILSINPTVSGRMLEKREAAKRDLGGFISDVGSPNPKDCRSATVYRLDSARLQVSSRLTFSIFADAGTAFTEFRAREALSAGANIVATTFLNDNSVLRWRNASFSGGEAGFCQVPATGQVYTTYVDSPAQWPAGCLPVIISILDPSQCTGGSTTSGSSPSTTSIATPIGSTQSITPISDFPSTPSVESSSSSGLSQATPRFANTTRIPSSSLATTSVLEPSESSSVPEPSTLDSSTTVSPVSSPAFETSDTSSSASTEPTFSLSTSQPSSLETSLTSQETSEIPSSTTDSTQRPSTSGFTASTTSTESTASSLSSDSTQSASSSQSTLSIFSTESTSIFSTESTSIFSTESTSIFSTESTLSSSSTSSEETTSSTTGSSSSETSTSSSSSSSETEPATTTSSSSSSSSSSTVSTTASATPSATPTCSGFRGYEDLARAHEHLALYPQTGYAPCLSLCDSMAACESFALDNLAQCVLYDYAIEDGMRNVPQSQILFFDRGGVCPPNLQVNLVENGDFETGDYSPWFIDSQTAGVAVSVVRSDSASTNPELHPTGLQYALKIEVLGNANPGPKTITFANQLTKTIAGHNYAISFDVTGCGSTNDLLTVLVGSTTIVSTVIQGDCKTWGTYSGTFTAVGGDEIQIVPSFSSSSSVFNQWYFDNFFVQDVTP